jgi:hypothetical protein
MKKLLLFLLLTILITNIAEARRSGVSSYRHYKSGGHVKIQKGYVRKKSGKYVAPHMKTSPDRSKANNLKKR